jgi:hypothetical protein
MVNETLHWSLTVPSGVSHADDWREGMFSPKDTFCLQNMCVINLERDGF